MSNYFKMLVFVVIICFFLGCSKNAELSLTQLLDRTISQEMPTLLFLSDTSSFRYRRVKEMLDNKEARDILKQFRFLEINVSEYQYFNQLLYSFATNYFIIMDNRNIVSIVPYSLSNDSILDRICNYKNHPLKDCIKDISLLDGDEQLISSTINQIFMVQYLHTKHLISDKEYTDSLYSSIKVLPYFYNQYLLCKMDRFGETNYAWLDSLNIWERKLYDLPMKELMLRRFNVDSCAKSNIKFENEVANLGKINLNESIEHIFYFSNISNAPSVIYNVEATCGCMVVSWPHAPILPGEKDSINVVFKGLSIGYFNKNIWVNTNSSKKRLVLKICGEVNEEKKVSL